MRTYISFDVPSYTGTVTTATLRVYASSNNSVGYRVYSSSNNWIETGSGSISFNNAPALGSLLGSSGSININTNPWTQVDVTSAIKGAGTIHLCLGLDQFNSDEFLQPHGWECPSVGDYLISTRVSNRCASTGESRYGCNACLNSYPDSNEYINGYPNERQFTDQHADSCTDCNKYSYPK